MAEATFVVERAAHGSVLQSVDGAELVLDIDIEQQPRWAATPTQSPVEEGADITDHIRLEPVELQLTARITATPLHAPIEGADRHIRVHADLVALRDARAPITVVTSLATFPSMVLTEVAPTRTGADGLSIVTTLRLQELRVVAQQTGMLPDDLLAALVRPSASARRTRGQAQPLPAPDAVAESIGDNRTALARLADGLLRR